MGVSIMKINANLAESKFKEEMVSLAPAALGLLVAIVSLPMVVYLAVLLFLEKAIGLPDYIQLFVLIVVASTLVFSLYVQREKEKLDESQAFLTSSVDLINKAYDILSDGGSRITTIRVSWVTAARLLTRSRMLASKITLPSHRIIFESEHDFQRHRFGDLLKMDGDPLPLEFFCGTGYAKGSVGDSAYNTIKSNGANNWLPVRVVTVIYQFKEYPEGYEDPLEGSRGFNNNEMNRLWLFGENGVCDYLVFRKHFHPIGEKVFFSNKAQNAVEVTASEIDEHMGLLSGQVPE